MMPLLRTLASCHLTQMSRINRTFSSPVAGAYRCLFTLTTVPRTPFLSATGICHSQAPSAGSPAQLGASLLGQCQRLPCIQPSAGMKTKAALRRRCKDCFFVRRRGRLFVFCNTNPRHKQRQG